MAFVLADRVLESSTTTGTGAFTLAGAALGFRSFASTCSVADTCWYYIEGVDAFGKPSGEYEYGLGTYSGANQLTRTTVRGSSNGGSLVNFTAGTKLVGIGVLAPSTPAAQSEWRAAIGDGMPVDALQNRVLNRSGRVQQRAAATLSALWKCGKADRLQARIQGGTSVSGSIDVTSLAAIESGIAMGIIVGTWTNGKAQLGHTIRAADAAHYNGRTVTVSCKLNHNFGGARDFTVQIVKANSSDNFAGYTVLATSSPISVPNTTTTVLSLTTTLGSTDGSNGLGIIISDTAANTVAAKSCVIGDLQMLPGSAPGSAAQIPYDLDLLLCRAYYESGSAGEFLNNTGGPATMSALVMFKTTKVQTPLEASINVGALQNVTAEWASFYQLAVPSGNYYQPGNYFIDAELYVS